MPLSFSINTDAPAPGPGRKKVLITGARGNIGAYLAEVCSGCHELRLMVHRLDEESQAVGKYGTVVSGDLGDLEGLKEICSGMDVVVHLAGNPDPGAVWEDLLRDNITGTYHLFTAAKAAGCRKIVYASSIHAVSGYPADVQVKTSDPVNPGDLYGVSKCFGEALGRYFATQEGMSVIVLRIGAFQPPSTAREAGSLPLMDAFLSQRDLADLVCRAIDNDTLRFAIFHALSDNRFKRLDISDARELLGFNPRDDFTSLNRALGPLHLNEVGQRAQSFRRPKERAPERALRLLRFSS